MNWSSYSRFVGDVFGAPLAMEGLLAFFLESTFLGMWIFGWDRLPKKIHLASIWLASLGTVFSAYFILAANAWMQHPVGYTINTERGRAELTDIVKVLTQNTAVASVFHTIPSAFLTAGAVIAGISTWLIVRKKEFEVAPTTLKLGAITILLSFILVGISGDYTARVMTTQQPMKMAAAEALYDTRSSAPFSVFTIGTPDGSRSLFQIGLPGMLSFMSTGSTSGTVEGINDLQSKYQQQFGPGDYTPNIPMAYWSFRWMIGFGGLTALIALILLWQTRKGGLPRGRLIVPAAVSLPFLPLFGNFFGWIFTENARQPWAVFGIFKTADGVSPTVSAGSVLFTLLVFTALYGVLAVIEFGLIFRAIKIGPAPKESVVEVSDIGGDSQRLLTMAY